MKIYWQYENFSLPISKLFGSLKCTLEVDFIHVFVAFIGPAPAEIWPRFEARTPLFPMDPTFSMDSTTQFMQDNLSV